MSQAVSKWGNSLAVRIPAALAKQMGLEEGDAVELRLDGERLVLEKADALPEFTHEDLQRALRSSRTKLVDFGRPRGREVL